MSLRDERRERITSHFNHLNLDHVKIGHGKMSNSGIAISPPNTLVLSRYADPAFGGQTFEDWPDHQVRKRNSARGDVERAISIMRQRTLTGRLSDRRTAPLQLDDDLCDLTKACDDTRRQVERAGRAPIDDLDHDFRNIADKNVVAPLLALA